MIKTCPYCGEYFSHKLLDMHKSICTKKHEMEKGVFTCPECGKQFTEKSEFSAHKDLHEKKQPTR